MARVAKPWLCASLAFGVIACGSFEDPTLEQDFEAASAAPPPSRAATSHDPHRNLLWGDLHIHTGLSFDAFTMGVRALPDDAYTFMKGGTIEHALGYPIRAQRPLDFGAVTEHAEYLGVPRHLAEDGSAPDAELIEALRAGSRLRTTWVFLKRTLLEMGSRDTRHETFGLEGLEAVSQAAWQTVIEAAERHNDPGRFTTFIAYEWSSMPEERNLHRNVIYASTAVPDYPVSSLDSENPEDLWRALDAQRAKGMDAIAIPHNGNVSDGRMWESRTFEGAPLSASYAELRSRNEPVAEIFQIKGTSETHPSLSPNDAFADFEIMDTVMSRDSPPSQPKGSYARDALRTGLEFAHREGFNPFEFGVIASSDSHNASFSVEEDNYHGKLPLMDGTPAQRLGVALLLPKESLPIRVYGAAGLVAVWAEENTRASIFSAMQRKETYATSGTANEAALLRAGGTTLKSYLQQGCDSLTAAYAGGVPMGGDSQSEVRGLRRSSSWSAMKDPARRESRSAADRQGLGGCETGRVTKRSTTLRPRVSRMSRVERGTVPPVGNTVDVAEASYDELDWRCPAGAPYGATPSFDPLLQQAVYYARVIEIPDAPAFDLCSQDCSASRRRSRRRSRSGP